MVPRYQIVLTQEERAQLERMTRDGKTPAKKFLYARALLLCDKGTGEGWKVEDAAAALGVTSRTIEHLKKRFAEGGIEGAFERSVPASPRMVKFDGNFEAHLIALACTEPPEGRALTFSSCRLGLLSHPAAGSAGAIYRAFAPPTVIHITVPAGRWNAGFTRFYLDCDYQSFGLYTALQLPYLNSFSINHF